jgi:hypothetical protein
MANRLAHAQDGANGHALQKSAKVSAMKWLSNQ